MINELPHHFIFINVVNLFIWTLAQHVTFTNNLGQVRTIILNHSILRRPLASTKGPSCSSQTTSCLLVRSSFHSLPHNLILQKCPNFSLSQHTLFSILPSSNVFLLCSFSHPSLHLSSQTRMEAISCNSITCTSFNTTRCIKVGP